MSREAFKESLHMSPSNKKLLGTVNEILDEYKSEGYILTLRQAYYQLVSRDIIPNTTKEYAKLSILLTKGRMAGIVDWAAIEDRGRQPKIPYYVAGVRDALDDTYSQYRIDRQKDQKTYVEVCVEKDALSSIFYRVTEEYHVRLMVNKGYSSCSAMYAVYQRILNAYRNGANNCTILYFGDHDPSGIDMIRDVNERVGEMLMNGDYRYLIDEKLEEVGGEDVEHIFQVKQLALNMKQIRKYSPPENPAKITDPRAKGYIERFGNKSWELDALKPQVLAKLCTDGIEEEIDTELYQEMVEKEEAQKEVIKEFMENYNEE